MVTVQGLARAAKNVLLAPWRVLLGGWFIPTFRTLQDGTAIYGGSQTFFAFFSHMAPLYMG